MTERPYWMTDFTTLERMHHVPYDDGVEYWLDDLYELKQQKPPFYYSHDGFGSPKYENGVLELYRRGMMPIEALEHWKEHGLNDE